MSPIIMRPSVFLCFFHADNEWITSVPPKIEQTTWQSCLVSCSCGRVGVRGVADRCVFRGHVTGRGEQKKRGGEEAKRGRGGGELERGASPNLHICYPYHVRNTAIVRRGIVMGDITRLVSHSHVNATRISHNFWCASPGTMGGLSMDRERATDQCCAGAKHFTRQEVERGSEDSRRITLTRVFIRGRAPVGVGHERAARCQHA
ncbi:hypothetical protein V8F20_002736 [Naviculisporaceae sp. PSN 640]